MQYKSEYLYTVNFFEVLSDLVIMLLIEKNLSHPMSLLILVAACECMITLLIIRMPGVQTFKVQKTPIAAWLDECKSDVSFEYR